jgi:dienelactone hydrolase
MSILTLARCRIPRFLSGMLVLCSAAAMGAPDDADDSGPGTKPVLPGAGRVFTDDADRRRLAEMWSADVRRRRGAANERETAAWKQIRSREGWEIYRDQRVLALRRSLGADSRIPADLKVNLTATVRGTGYLIDNLVFESRPGLLVTANLYRPSDPHEATPGILICHSHHNPKSQSELQEMGVLWARQGCLVLVMDQLGHGERRQHPFRTNEDFAGDFRPGRQDYYFRYNAGMQLHLVGESLIGWMAWDLMRGVDLLLSRPGIERSRIILLGAVAGGGDPAAVTAALDPRITAVVPFNFGGPQPETTYPLPADAELSFDYFGGASWESTRNLRLSALDGFAPWVIVGSVAPRRLLYAHEFAWDREHDPVWRRLETIYRLYGDEGNLGQTHGEGSVRASGPGNTHCNNIGPEHLVAIHAAFERWFQIPVPKREDLPRHSAGELTCLPPAVAADRLISPLHKIAKEIGARQVAAARVHLAKSSPLDRRRELRRDWARLLGDVEPRQNPVISARAPTLQRRVGTTTFVATTIERIALDVEPEIVIPLLLLIPSRETASRRPVVVGVAQEGKGTFLENRDQAIADLLTEGIAVCLPDLRGTGETKPDDGRGRNSSATSLSSSELMLGQTALGARIRDLRSVLRYVRTRPEFDARRIALWGESFAPRNPREKTLAVPLDASESPPVAEPLGGLAVLLASLFEDDVCAVSARGGLAEFVSVLESPFVYIPHDVIVPGALTAGDLCDVAAALAPCPLQLADLVDGQNRALTAEETALAFAPVNAAYGPQAASTLLLMGSGADSAAKWLIGVMRE